MGVELRHQCNSARVGRSAVKRERLADYNRRTEQRYGWSNRETLLVSMPSVFPLQPSCHVAYCSSDSWSPQSRSLLVWNLCDGYKRKTKIITRRRETDIRGFGWVWNCATARQVTDEVHGIGRQHESAVTARMPLANAILFVLVLRKKAVFIFRDIFPINEECRFDELLVRFRRWVGQSNKKERLLDAYNSSTQMRL